MRNSQKRPTDYVTGDKIDNTQDPSGRQSLKPSKPRIIGERRDDPYPNDKAGQPVMGAYPEGRLEKGHARVKEVNLEGAEAAGADGMKKNSDF
jgi:hypothetical protein